MENTEDRTGPSLVGWRSKLTGIVYWNACTQTSCHDSGGQDKKERIVQTDFLVDRYTNVEHDVGVQTNIFPDVRDRIVGSTQKDRESMDPIDERILESVIKIQRFYRAHRGGRTASRLASVSARAKNTDRLQTETVPGRYRGQDFAILNRTEPRTATDFELLYNMLDRWRDHETKKAAELLFDASRIALSSLILSKEVELLRGIDAMKTNVKLKRKEKACRKFLDDLSMPVVWRDRRGEPIYVETARVKRAKYFKEIFDGLSREGVPIQQRAEMLKKLRKEIEPHTCKESDELLRVLDQELFFLSRNVAESKLNWLRCRSRMAFLRLARQALEQEQQDPSHFRLACKTICRSCGRPLAAVEKFARENRRSSTCNYCLYAKVRAGPTIVHEPYRKLLRDVRRHEARLRCYTSLAFVIDPGIVYRLVNGIWHGRSAISDNDRLEELRLVRFLNGEPWSPWNCIPLTESEASLHRRVDDLEQFYGPMILQKFYTKNMQAKVRFGSVAEFKSGRETSGPALFPPVD